MSNRQHCGQLVFVKFYEFPLVDCTEQLKTFERTELCCSGTPPICKSDYCNNPRIAFVLIIFLNSDIALAMSGSRDRSGMRMHQIEEIEETIDHQRM